MDRFENARVFAAVIEAGGFTAAAERLGLSRAATSKHVLQLEERLGARLLDRTTRRVSATDAGRRFYEQCRRILAELDEAERSASELHNEPRGELRVIAPTNFGLTELGTAITDLVVAYPKLRVNLTVNDHVTDPIEAGYDIAISVGMPRGTVVEPDRAQAQYRAADLMRRAGLSGAARHAANPRRPHPARLPYATAISPSPTSGTSSARTANAW